MRAFVLMNLFMFIMLHLFIWMHPLLRCPSLHLEASVHQTLSKLKPQLVLLISNSQKLTLSQILSISPQLILSSIHYIPLLKISVHIMKQLEAGAIVCSVQCIVL